MTRGLIIVSIILLLTCFSLSAQKKKAVIETSVGNNVEESIKSTFMSALSAGLTNSGKFVVLTNREEYAQKLQGEINAQNLGYIDDAEWIELGHAIGTDYVIYTRIDCIGNNYLITVGMTDVRSGVAHKTIDPLLSTFSDLAPTALKLAKILSDGAIEQHEDNAVQCNAIDGCSLWIESKNRAESSWEEAVSTCEKKGNGWRLPSVAEMVAICNQCRYSPKRYESPFLQTTYWTKDKRNNFSVYTVSFPSGGYTYESMTSYAVYRCIKEE